MQVSSVCSRAGNVAFLNNLITLIKCKNQILAVTNHTANVLTIKTTDFVCLQNPAIDQVYFKKKSTADYMPRK